MRIQLEISGGFAPQLAARRFEVESTALAEPERRELDRLVALAVNEPPPLANPKLRDAQYYDLVIQPDDQSQHRISTADGQLTSHVQELIRFLKRTAAPK